MSRCIYLNPDRQQCRLEAYHAGEHDYRPKEAGSMLGRVTAVPHCPGCGTTSTATPQYPGGAPCSVCSQLPRFAAPKATIEVGTQPEPAYERADYAGNFRRKIEET